MPDDFLHGVETVEVQASSGTVSTVKTAVIALIGTAHEGSLNVMKLCLSDADDAYFGLLGTIPEALAIIRQQHKNAIVFAVSVGLDTSTPIASLFVGDVDVATGVRTGLKMFDECRSLYGFVPKIFIAPRYSATAAIATALRGYAETYRGAAYLDSPIGMLIATALTSRGTSGLFNFSDYRAKVLFPGVLNDASAYAPTSAFASGLRAKIDNLFGFWFSSSNNQYVGVRGLETPVSFELSNTASEANLLNAAGITTIANMGSGGLREWGNRNLAFPTNTDPRTFEAIQRLDDITAESIELAMVPFIDKPMTKAQIDLVSDTVQSYFNTLISRGALMPGSKCYFDPTKNSTVEMAKGHYVWTKDFMGAVPGERFTFYSNIDINLLSSLITTS